MTTCERRLWGTGGEEALDWLTVSRGFDEAVLRVNRVGFDPGPDGFLRPSGLPRRGPAVVLPALDDRGKAIFHQARYLDPATTGRKYDNPPNWLAPNAKVATLRLSDPRAATGNRVVITEGIPDALAAVTAGYEAIAILGTANTGADVAQCLASIEGTLVVAFDSDPAGRDASTRLIDSLASCGRDRGVVELQIPERWSDLNEWILAHPFDAASAIERKPRFDRTTSTRSSVSIGLSM